MIIFDINIHIYFLLFQYSKLLLLKERVLLTLNLVMKYEIKIIQKKKYKSIYCYIRKNILIYIYFLK